MNKKRQILWIFLIVSSLFLGACGTQEETDTQSVESQNEEIDFNSLSCTGNVELNYATQFQIEEYGNYDLITIVSSGRFLLVPENTSVPIGLPDDVVVLQQPLNQIYLVATAAMDLIQSADALSNIKLSGTKESGWHIEEAVTAMEDGDILYAGKYSAPDYELILSSGCDLAIESTMIYHNPEVKEKLESLGIPVLVETSSYEEHPLGRLEWIKLYGVLFNKEEEAETFYEEQLAKIEPVMEKDDTGKTVAFFSVNSNSSITVRKSGDYISKTIELSGGHYVIGSLEEEEENSLSTMNIQMEDFYAMAKEADILIYNSTIEGELHEINELINKNQLFADFKAVQNGNVYCTTGDFFQKSTGVGDFMVDLYEVFTDTETKTTTYLKKLE